ncbi:ABC transporter family protein [Artemisia annua]|uniref:ABC transporter family protein n=1 Tax=Artemisia annua TaxID=35608 RepID=A0A2U1NRM2_ARTAN|nr:ABC transporter family protein [Artemisia annua]
MSNGSKQLGVIKAVKNTLSRSEDVTALWVTHGLEELEYADGVVYIEDGRVVMHDVDPRFSSRHVLDCYCRNSDDALQKLLFGFTYNESQ